MASISVRFEEYPSKGLVKRYGGGGGGGRRGGGEVGGGGGGGGGEGLAG